MKTSNRMEDRINSKQIVKYRGRGGRLTLFQRSSQFFHDAAANQIFLPFTVNYPESLELVRKSWLLVAHWQSEVIISSASLENLTADDQTVSTTVIPVIRIDFIIKRKPASIIVSGLFKVVQWIPKEISTILKMAPGKWNKSAGRRRILRSFTFQSPLKRLNILNVVLNVM